ncbi:MAG: hypothetical protein RSA79_00065 [Oscillospiraceae bacterium]
MIAIALKKDKLFLKNSLIENNLIEEITSDIHTIESLCSKFRLANQYSHIIIDIDNFNDTNEDIVQGLYLLLATTKAQIIVIVTGRKPGDTLLNSLVSIGIYNIINDIKPEIIVEHLHTLLKAPATKDDVNLFFSQTADDKHKLDFFKKFTRKKEKEKQELQIKAPTKTIAVAGTQSRIGTTTQAICLIKYLQSIGKTACYVDITNFYVTKIKDYYDCLVDVENGKITCQNIDMFYKVDIAIKNKDYDYMIFDYGVLKQNETIISYIEKDIKFLVCGAKLDELEFTTNAISTLINEEIKYIFSFVSENDYKNILTLMEHKANVTTFAKYAPDCFNPNVADITKIFSNLI